ncbi:MAG: hypothetical protein KJ625_01805, partial [Actinobacteria bacterium]|nr:hypothetical protein [Actinomycetota bacterium]
MRLIVHVSGLGTFGPGREYGARTSMEYPNTRRRVALIAVAAVILLLSMAGVSCGVPEQSWALQYQTGPNSLTAVSALDPSHVWAVGNGTVYFFGGNGWSKQYEDPEKGPRDICAVDPCHAWASGGNGKGEILFHDGSTWVRQFETGDGTINPIAAADAVNVWAVGANDDGANIYHFDGSAWTIQHSAPMHVQDISAADAVNVWAVGEDDAGRSNIYHFDGSSWSSEHLAAAGEYLIGVCALDPTHVWAVGYIEGWGAEGDPVGVIYFFDGERWIVQH